jgi:hypothetical protein
MEGLELGFRYAAIAIRVEVFEGRGTTRATGTARSFHAFRTWAEITTGRRTLAESTVAAFTTTGRAITFTVAVKLATGRRALTESTVVTLRASFHAVAFGAAVEIAAGRGPLAEATLATFAASGRAIAFGAAVKITTRRRALAEVTIATFAATRHAMAFGAAIKLAAGRRALAITAITAFAATGRTVTFTVAVELATGRGPVAITATAAFGPTIFRSGEFRVTIATAGTFRFPPHFRARARSRIRSRTFLRSDHAAQTNQAKRAETASKEHRRPDTALFKNSFAAHLDILLTVRRAVSGVLGFDSGGPAPIGRVIRPSSCPTVAPEHNGSRHVQITSS